MSGILRARRADGRDRLRSGVDGNGFRARAAHARTAPHTRRSAAPLSRSVEAARGIAPCRIDTADSRRAEQLMLTLAMALRALMLHLATALDARARPSSRSIRACGMPPARKDYSWRRVRNVVAAGASVPVKDVWTISGQFFAEQHAIPGSHPSYRNEEPASPKTCITLLTGGLLVRVQPEEPNPPSSQ